MPKKGAKPHDHDVDTGAGALRKKVTARVRRLPPERPSTVQVTRGPTTGGEPYTVQVTRGPTTGGEPYTVQVTRGPTTGGEPYTVQVTRGPTMRMEFKTAYDPERDTSYVVEARYVRE